jgi:hypothetical protein
MATRGGNRRERAAQALACGLSLRKAAAKCQVGFRTLARWHAEDPDFRARVSALRTALAERAAGQLAAAGARAARELARQLAGGDDRHRLAVAVKILELGPKLRDAAEIARRLEDLERRVNSQHGGANG